MIDNSLVDCQPFFRTKAILDSRNNTSSGVDGIPIDLKKKCHKEISPILTLTIFLLQNLSMSHIPRLL